MTPAPDRRWFRFAFSLRTMFVVVTVLCLWLGWNANIVLERKAFIEMLKRQGHNPYRATISPNDPFGATGGTVFRGPGKFRANPLPWVRRMLGDEPVPILGLPDDMDAAQVRRVRKLFPETPVMAWKGETIWARPDSPAPR